MLRPLTKEEILCYKTRHSKQVISPRVCMLAVSRQLLKYLLSLVFLSFLLVLFWNSKMVRQTTYPSPFTGDMLHYYIPSYVFTAENLTRFHLPLWDPYQMCGVPYLAALQGGVFYPPVLLFSVFSPLKAYSLYMMLHIILGGLFIVIFCRYLKISWLSSIAAAVTFMLCNNTIDKLFGPAFLANSIYLPLMLIFVSEIFKTNKFKWVFALSLSFAIPLLAGWVQALVYCAYVLAAFSVALAIRMYVKKQASTARIMRAFPLLLFSGVIFLLVTAAQTFPVVELGRQGTRSFEPLSGAMVTIFNTACYGPYRMIFDMVNANGARLPYYLYMGVLPLILSVCSFFETRRRFYVFFLWAIAFFSLIFSMGPQTPLFGLAYRLPLLGMFRAPFRILTVYAFAISVLCGIGLDFLLKKIGSVKEKRSYFPLLILLGLSFLAFLAFYAWPNANPRKSQVIELLCAALRWKYYLLVFSLFLTIAVVAPIKEKAARLLVALGCIAIIFLDLYKVQYQYYLPDLNTPLFSRNAAALQKLRDLTIRDNSRAFIVSEWDDYSLSQKQGLFSGFPLINDYENMNPLIYNNFVTYLFGRTNFLFQQFFTGSYNLDEELTRPKLLNYMSTKYILINRKYLETNKRNAAENYGRLKEFCSSIYIDPNNEILLNPEALPRAYVVNRYHGESDDQKALETLDSEKFSARDEVVLSGRKEFDFAPLSCTEADVAFEKSEPEHVIISADLNGNGLLVLTDQFYPGWSASIDGNPTEIYRANYLFRCVEVPAGQHRITFDYRPKSFFMGTVFSGVAIAIIVLTSLLSAFVGRKRRMRAQEVKDREVPATQEDKPEFSVGTL
jgi:hypothetical protein